MKERRIPVITRDILPEALRWFGSCQGRYAGEIIGCDDFDRKHQGKTGWMTDTFWGSEAQLNTIVKRLVRSVPKGYFLILISSAGISIETVPGKHMDTITRIITKSIKNQKYFGWTYSRKI